MTNDGRKAGGVHWRTGCGQGDSKKDLAVTEPAGWAQVDGSLKKIKERKTTERPALRRLVRMLG